MLQRYLSRHQIYRLLLTLVALIIIFPTIKPASAATTPCSLEVNKPYRSPADSVVYLVTPECTRRPFFNPDVYFSHFSDWNQVKFIEQVKMNTIPDDVLRFVPWGPLRTFKNGSLVKLTSNPNVYLLEDGKAYPLADENAFKAFGYSFDQVEDVTSATLEKFVIRTNALKTASDAPPSLVFKYSNQPDVYVLKLSEGRLAKSHLTSMKEVNDISRGDRIAVLSTDVVFADIIFGSSASDTIAPTITLFNFASPSSTSPNATIGMLIATDNVGVTGYFVSESTSTPSLNSTKWTSFVPASYSFSSTTGTKTLYIWAKDAIGNISASQNASVTIVDPSTDITPPIITSSITVTPNSGSMTFSWITNEASNSVVKYGTTDSYGNTTTSNDLVTTHNAIITGLIPNTLYHLRISSTDVAGNTKASEDTTATTKKDTSPPVVTAFNMPASSTSMLIPISAFTATDDVGVTGYMVTKTTSIPLADSADWLSSPPANYSFAKSGDVTLYAWVKDSSGNISSPRIASSVISASGLTYPSISNINVVPSLTSATITWLTTQPSKSVVSYGRTQDYGTSVGDDSYISAHSAILTGLTPGVTYYYIITATNISGLEQNSGVLTVRI